MIDIIVAFLLIIIWIKLFMDIRKDKKEPQYDTHLNSNYSHLNIIE